MKVNDVFNQCSVECLTHTILNVVFSKAWCVVCCVYLVYLVQCGELTHNSERGWFFSKATALSDTSCPDLLDFKFITFRVVLFDKLECQDYIWKETEKP